MLSREKKAAWLRALRSGEYIFGRGKYYDHYTKTHCALGVLLEVCGINLKEKLYASDGDFMDVVLPEGFQDLIAINDHASSYAPAIAFIEESL